MKFNKFLNESVLRKSIMTSELKEMLKKHCSDAVDRFLKGYKILRGDAAKEMAYIFTPTGKRRSRNTSNYYTEFINNHPMWKDYPKREVICSTNHQSYGWESYIVFPFDGAKIGVCPEDDLWYSFYDITHKYRFTSMKELNQAIEKLNVADTWNEMKTKLPKTPLKNFKNPHTFVAQYDDYDLEEDTVWDFLETELDPKKNDFKVIKIKDYNFTDKDAHEVWTDSKCIFVHYNSINLDWLRKNLE